MRLYRNLFTIIMALMLVFTQLPCVSAATTNQVIEKESGQQQTLQQILETTTDTLWNSANSRLSLNYDLLLAYMQTELISKGELQKKVPVIATDTLTNVTNTAAALVAVQSNPYAYHEKNYGGILSSSQVGEGYFSLNSDNDKMAEGFIKALFALELMSADYNRETALNYLLSDNVLQTVNGVTSVKGDSNGLLSGLAISVLIGYQDESEVARQKINELLEYVKKRERHFAAALGLYVDNLYALGENPLDAKWNIMYEGKSLPLEDAYRQLIIATGIKNGLHAASKESTSSWSLLGLASLTKGKSLIQQAKQQFTSQEFDFSPKTIEVSNVKHQFLAQGVPFKPTFIIKDEYGTPRKAKVVLQSSNPSVLTINEKNELIGLVAGDAIVTASIEGYPGVRTVLSFIVTEDASTNVLLEQIASAIDYLDRQANLSSFHDATALKTFGYPKSKLERVINVYGLSNPYNEARNILSIVAAGNDPKDYNGNDRVAFMHVELLKEEELTAEKAAHIILAQHVIGETPDQRTIDFLLQGLTEKDGQLFVQYNNKPYISETASVLLALAIVNGLEDIPEVIQEKQLEKTVDFLTNETEVTNEENEQVPSTLIADGNTQVEEKLEDVQEDNKGLEELYADNQSEEDATLEEEILELENKLEPSKLNNTRNDLEQAEAKVFAFFKENYKNGNFASEKEKNAVAVLNYLSIKNKTAYENFNAVALANVVLDAQVNNSAFTNGSIPGLSGLTPESTGMGLNAVSSIFTNKNAYLQLKEKNEQKATTIVFDLPEKAKINEMLSLKAELLDQNGQAIDATITWTVDGKLVTDSYTPTTSGVIVVRAEAAGISAEKSIEVIDYQKVFSFTIEPIENALIDIDISLNAKIEDSAGQIVTDEPIIWGVEPSKGAMINGSVVRFSEPGQYTITASAGGVRKALDLTVDLNPDSIYTQVVQATEKMKQYLENRRQYDYVSALAYRNVVNAPEKSQEQMRVKGHLREYGNHDNKFALYYAKNIFLAVAANEDPRQFKAYKGKTIDLVTPLIKAQDSDGHFTMAPNFDKSSVSTQALSIIALDLIKEPYEKEKAVRDLLRGLNGPISEGAYKETELRALSLIALSKHRNIDGVEKQIENNLNYIKAKQNDDGGFDYGGYSNSPFAIGTIIQGLMAVGENPYEAKWKKNGMTMVEVLLKQQIKNGGFKFGDGFDGDFSFDELKATEGGFGALADLYTKTSMYNEAGIILDPLPGQNDKDVKPFIEISDLDLKQDQPLLTMKVKVFDNIDGELTPTVKVNDKPIYSVSNTYKAVVANGENIVTVTSINSSGNESTERIPVLFQSAKVIPVPQVTINVVGVNGTSMYSEPVIIEDGDTAYSVLVKAIGKKSIQSSPHKDGVYIVGISGLKELDHGKDSGWMYRVNGVFPSVYAGAITLNDGDKLDWIYTTNLGQDIGAYFPPNSVGGGEEKPKPEVQEIPVKSKEPFVLDKEFQKDVSAPVIVTFDKENKELPRITASRGNVLLEIPQGTKVTTEWNGKLQLPTILNPSELDLKQINNILGLHNKQISKVDFRLKVGGVKTITFDRHVTLTLKDKGDSEAGFIGESGEFKLIKKYPSVDATDEVYAYTSKNDLIIKTNHFTEFVTFKSTSIDRLTEFTDVTDGWAKEFIETAVQTGLIKGYYDGTFQPNKSLTRAQAASIIVRGLELTIDKSSSFKDIGSYAKETQAEIAAAYQHGIVMGQQGNFNPSGEVTRAQLALMLHRAYTQKTGKEYVAKQTTPYPDLGSYDKETVNAISMLHELKIATGSDGKYKPATSTTRAQAAKMFVNFFETLE